MNSKSNKNIFFRLPLKQICKCRHSPMAVRIYKIIIKHEVLVYEIYLVSQRVVKGSVPVVNDRVLVEAVCLPNMPFKWNATRIQVLPMNDAPRNNNKKGFLNSPSSADRGSYAAVPPPGDFDDSRRDRDRDRDRDRRRGRSRERNRNRSPLPSHDEDRRRKERRDRDDKDKEKEREKEREREKARSRSPKKSSSRQQVVKKYRVRVPEFPLDLPHLKGFPK